MSDRVERTRIPFAGVPTAVYAQGVERWRDLAAGSKLPKIGHRVATVLPRYLNRECGYLFPGDEEIADIINTTPRSVGRGMVALDDVGLIERETMVKHHQGSRAVGRMRRIYLTEPKPAGTSQVETSALNERTETGLNERTTNERTGLNERTETSNERTETGRMNGRTSVRITSDVTSDNRTSDEKIRSGGVKVSTVPPARENPYPMPTAFGDDLAFLEAFDRFVLALTPGGDIGAGEMERVTREAFDQATDSDDNFMPFHWVDVCGLRTEKTAEWFRYRAGALVHRRAA